MDGVLFGRISWEYETNNTFCLNKGNWFIKRTLNLPNMYPLVQKIRDRMIQVLGPGPFSQGGDGME